MVYGIGPKALGEQLEVDENEDETHRLSQAFLDCLEGQLGFFMVDKPPFKFHKGKI